MVSPSSACAVMLANGRPDMVRQAIQCFRGQSYNNAWLLIWDNGAAPLSDLDLLPREIYAAAGSAPRSIGALRNEAIAFAQKQASALGSIGA